MTDQSVSFVINSLAGGGAERVMATLLAGSRDRFARFPHELVLLDEEPDAYPVPGWLPLHRLSTKGSLIRGFVDLFRLVLRRRPRALVSFLTRANVLCVIVGRVLGCKVIISERVNTSSHLAGNHHKLSRLLVRATYRFAHRVIAVSGGVADDLVANFGVARERITSIANPVDVDAIMAQGRKVITRPCSGPYLVAMGRLTATKNMALLIDAYAVSGVEVPLVIMGEGPERPALEAQIASLNLSDRVHLLWFQDNPHAIVYGSELYVSASNGEGFPNALVEAMVLSRPVVVTNCASGPSEILAGMTREAISETIDTPAGILVPVNDATALASAISVMMHDRERRQRDGDAAHAMACSYGVQRAVDEYWSVIGQVIGGA